ncbi:MAG: hypothetical protein J6K20_03650 [Thermoguttaceae bacterium]|nr:hypothetical protein [Thermoguttaceae bacterium]MBQ7028705.1 hypothetical protein [Thermoguttaceae bacterium]
MQFPRLRSFNSSSDLSAASLARSLTAKGSVAALLFLAAFASTALVGCFGGKGDSENVAAVSSPAVEKATSEALQELQRLTVLNGKQNATLCFLGVSGKGDLGGLSEAARQQIETSSSFRLLEKSAVQAALKESDVRANNLFIPAERKKFVAALGEPVDYLLAGYVEKGSVPTDGANVSAAQNDEASENAKKVKIFKLELVELETNRKFEFVAPLER